MQAGKSVLQFARLPLNLRRRLFNCNRRWHVEQWRSTMGPVGTFIAPAKWVWRRERERRRWGASRKLAPQPAEAPSQTTKPGARQWAGRALYGSLRAGLASAAYLGRPKAGPNPVAEIEIGRRANQIAWGRRCRQSHPKRLLSHPKPAYQAASAAD